MKGCQICPEFRVFLKLSLSVFECLSQVSEYLYQYSDTQQSKKFTSYFSPILTLIEPESQKMKNMKVIGIPLGFPYQFELAQSEFRPESYGQNTKGCQICPEFHVFLKLSLSVSESLCSRVFKYPLEYLYALF